MIFEVFFLVMSLTSQIVIAFCVVAILIVIGLRLGNQQKEEISKNYIFLSWTKNRPRDNAAMQGIIKSLKNQGYNFFDYTEFQAGSKSNEEEIKRTLNDAVRSSTCSIEIISSEILTHDWVQYERRLIGESNIKRYFIVLDKIYNQTKSFKAEHNITRIDFSDGRISSNHSTKIEHIINPMDNSFYRSKNYYLMCDDFVNHLTRDIMLSR